MHISEWVFKKNKIFWFLLVAIVFGGIFSYDRLGKLEDPEINIMVANVVTIYPGASAHEVELKVTDVFDNMVVEELRVVDGDNLILDPIFLVPDPPLKRGGDKVTMITLSIWLANAHCFKQTPLKAMYSYFYACYLATLYSP